MPYYTYESLVNKGLRFEIIQSIHDAPMEHHAALAASVLKKHSETPKYCGQKTNLMKKQISHHSHSHSKSGQCSGVK